MKIVCVTLILLLTSSASTLPAQARPKPSPIEPLLADVHASPYRASINLTVNISKQRFDMRNATIVNMIDFAHGRPDDDGREDSVILGGPTWIDLDRFDIAAIIPSLQVASSNDSEPGQGGPRGSSSDKLEPLVERILVERFHLKYHTEDRPLPGFIVTVAKDGPKLTAAKDPAAPGNCQSLRDKPNAGELLMTCTSETIGQFLAQFGGLFRHTLIDRTGLDKPYDFTLKLHFEQTQTRQDAINAYTDAFNRQLGIVVAAGNPPQPAFVVDAVDRSPPPNAPEIAKLIPALPDLEFDVASIRPAADSESQHVRFTGSQLDFVAYPMQELLRIAWNLPTGAMLGNAPEWLGRRRYTILVKLPPEISARAFYEDADQLDNMLQKLLVDRFRIKYHWGVQTQDGYVLLGGTPKMKKAAPNSRSFCKYGPAEGERDMRTSDSPFTGEFHCQNVTMAQLADLIQPMAKSEVKNRVVDRTGLAGAYDFTLYYTSARKLRTDADLAAKAGGETAAAPSGGLSIEDAFRKELGLKFVKQPGTYPALILDHIEQTPTEN